MGHGQLEIGPFLGKGTHWVCWAGLLKCVACSNSWTPEKSKATAVKTPQRMTVNVWKVREPMTSSAPEKVAVSIDPMLQCCSC